jgi:hypothetical protein
VPFPRTSLSLTERHPKDRTENNSVGDWVATWTIDFTGAITIYFQQSYWDKLIKAGLEWEIVHTLQHEYVEARLSINLARKKYPDKNPFVMAEKDEDLGGEAHYLAIKELDGVSVATYENALDTIGRYLRSMQ